MTSIFLRSVSLVFAGLVLSACSEDVPAEVNGLERISASSVVEKFKSGAQFCTKPDTDKGNCTTVQVLKIVNSDGITISGIFGKPYVYKATYTQKYSINDDKLCTKISEFINSVNGYSTSNDEAKITEYDKIQEISKQDAARKAMTSANSTNINSDYCYSYYKLEEPHGDRGVLILTIEYIDGVLQPFDKDNTAMFFTKESSLGIRDAE